MVLKVAVSLSIDYNENNNTTVLLCVTMIRWKRHSHLTTLRQHNASNRAVKYIPAGSRFTEALDLGGAEHEPAELDRNSGEKIEAALINHSASTTTPHRKPSTTTHKRHASGFPFKVKVKIT